MKKTLKVFSVILLAMTLLFAFSQPVSFAGYGENVNEIIKNATNDANAKDVDSGVNKLSTTIINWIWYISIIIAVIVVMIIGIKYLIGSTQEKAKYKESLIPLVVGILLIVFATTIVKVLFAMNSGT